MSTNNIGFVPFGDPGQLPPIGGLPAWCIDHNGNIHSLKGIMDFRDIFRMKPLAEVKCYQKVKSMSKKNGADGKIHQDYGKYYQEFGQDVYIGDYNAVYMDETMRTDNSKASEVLFRHKRRHMPQHVVIRRHKPSYADNGARRK